MFFVILFLLRKTFEFDPDGVDIRSDCLKNNFVRILNGFQDEDRKSFDLKVSQNAQLWKEVPYCSNWTYS